jgi:hypothetical protein
MDAGDVGDAPCLQSLDARQPFGPCPATFDDQIWRSSCVIASQVTEQICDGYRSRRIFLGTHEWTCYYDPTGLTLVAGYFQDDVTDFCGRTSDTVVAGDIPAAGSCGAPTTPDGSCGPGDAALE